MLKKYKIYIHFLFILAFSLTQSIVNESKMLFNADYLENLKKAQSVIEVAIIGFGMAGASAAIFTSRQGLHTVAFTGDKVLGNLKEGVLVENMPGVFPDSGAHVMENIEEQAQKFGTYICDDTILELDFNSYPYKLKGRSGKEYSALSIILTSGANPRRLGKEGEDEFWNKGIFSCGLCDAHLAKDQDVVIIGNDEYAADRVMQLSNYAQNITLILPSEKLEFSKALNDKISNMSNLNIIYNSEVIKFVGEDKLTSVIIKNLKTKKLQEIKTHWVFEAIGFKPNTELFKGKLALDSEGYLKVDAFTLSTGLPLVYAAGMVCDPRYHLAAPAAGDATKAAYNVWSDLNNLEINEETSKLLKQNLFIPKRDNEIKEIKSEKELNEIISNNDLVLVDFYVSGCPACHNMYGKLKNLAPRYKDFLKMVKVEKTSHGELATKFGIEWVPTLLLFSKGKLIKLIENQMTEGELDEQFKHIISEIKKVMRFKKEH